MREDRAARLRRELDFWLEVLEDHAEFIRSHLDPAEERLAGQAGQFRALFREVRSEAAPAVTGTVAAVARKAAESLIDFKQHLLDLSLLGEVRTHLTPTFYAHMIAEAEQFLKVARRLQEGEVPPLAELALEEHNLWLPDAAGHAAALAARLDAPEAELRLQAASFEQLFDGMSRRAWEMWRMLRRNPRMVPQLRALGAAAARNAGAFRRWLETLAREVEDFGVLSAIQPLLVDHMIREETYYLERIREIEAEDR